MAAITVQLAEHVVDAINAATPFAGELQAERKPIAHLTREDIEDLQVIVSPGPRTSQRLTRSNVFERSYSISVVIDYAVETTDNEKSDVFWEVVEQIENTIEAAFAADIGTRRLLLMRIDPDPDTSGLTDSQHMVVGLTTEWKEVCA